MNIRGGISTKPAWVFVLLMLAVSSMAVGLLSPQLTKSGSLTGSVAERVFITTVNGVSSGGCTAGTAAQTLGGEHFEAQFFVYIGECVGYSVYFADSGTQDTIGALSCTAPNGVLFAASAVGGEIQNNAATPASYTYPSGRIGLDTYVAYAPSITALVTAFGGSPTSGGTAGISSFWTVGTTTTINGVAFASGTTAHIFNPYFTIFFKGLTEGEYAISCTLGEASNFPVT